MMMMMMNLCKASSACRLIVERSTFLSARAAHLITIVIRRNDHWSALSWHDHHDENYQVTWLRLFPQGDSSLVESVDVEPAQISIVNVSSYIRCSVFIYQMCAENHHCHFSFVGKSSFIWSKRSQRKWTRLQSPCWWKLLIRCLGSNPLAVADWPLVANVRTGTLSSVIVIMVGLLS